MKKASRKSAKKTAPDTAREKPVTPGLLDPVTKKFLPGNPKAWKPGQSGNPKGRPPDALKRMKTVLKEILSRRTPGDNQTLYQKLGDVIVREALKGDEKFIRLILDRIEGPVPQVLAGEKDAPPLQFVIRPLIEGKTAEDPTDANDIREAEAHDVDDAET